MATKTVYQTLEDRGNVDDVEKHGPYPCDWENTWLGNGYYFWDAFIDNAHWWGKEVRKYPNGYIICKAICEYNDIQCCDLVGNTEHLLMFQNAFEMMKVVGLANNDTKVKRLIDFMKDEIKTFKFEAIRVHGIKSKSNYSDFSFKLNFEDNRPSYLDFKPAIQICFYKKTSLNLRNYEIVYPEEYISGYMV